MAGSPRTKKSTRAVGVTHAPLPKEKESQRRVPERGTKKDKGRTPQDRGKRPTKAPAAKPGPVKPREERTIARRGGKGGKTSGSRAGLVSHSEKRKKRT